MFLDRIDTLNQLIENCLYTTLGASVDHRKALEIASSLFLQVRQKRGTVYPVGNGGSAGIASHFHCDLMRTLKIPSLTLFDSSLMTCISNDFGYEEVFSTPLKTLLREGDLLVAISSSGKSQNILNAVEVARAKGVQVITLSGFLPDNPLRIKGDLNFFLGVEEYGLVEMGHFFLLHTIVDSLQRNLNVASIYGK